MAPKLSLEARRWRMIIISVPIIGATSTVLYKRLVMGEPQRAIPKGDLEAGKHRILELKPEQRKAEAGADQEDTH